MKSLSIVVPVYNAEKTIHVLLDSVLSSEQDFEVICVIDGSTDNTEKIIKNYNDNRVKIFTKENEGTFKTWQYGVKKSSGEYVTIFDQDDYIERDYIDYILDFISNIGADVLFTPYYVEKESGENTICEIGIDDGLYTGENFQKIKNQLLNGYVPYAKFTKVVKKELYQKQIEHTYQGQLRDFEDWLTMVEIFAMATSVQICNKPYYHYIQYSNSVSKSTTSYKRNFDSLMRIIEFMNENSKNKIGENNYNSLCFKALNIMLGKCLSIEEYDLAEKIVSMGLYHDNIMKSNLSFSRKVMYYTKSFWIIKAYKRIKGRNL